jgi:hypothetical protein
MNIECGDCSDFVELTERHFGEILKQHGFRPVKCSSDRGGRECMLMVESDANRLLFVRSDGAETCELGSLNAALPEAGLYGEGEHGWYHIVTMLEFRTGKKLLTRRRLNRFLERKEDHFAWQAELLTENAALLFGLFQEGNEETWRDEFTKYYQALIKG